MRIGIYHPDLDLFGGGEAVAVAIAEALGDTHDVEILCARYVSKDELSKFFDVNLGKVKVVQLSDWMLHISLPRTLRPSITTRRSYLALEEYDLVIDTCTNGLFDRKLKPKTVCYIHYPNFFAKKRGFKKIINPFMISKDRAFCYDKIFCNSGFTKSMLSAMTDKDVEILYPPVRTDKIRPKKKQKRIVSIGRFTPDKKHEVMIDAFCELQKSHPDYSLHLIGSFRKDSEFYSAEYLQKLRKMARGAAVDFHLNLPHPQCLRFLEESEIYWHARGYGESDPAEYENFGITTVEAMAAGCIPIVINLGAQPEIVQDGKTGYCWNNPDELISFTKMALKQDQKGIVERARRRTRTFDVANFYDRLKGLLSSLEQ